jgi:hypothetical protein
VRGFEGGFPSLLQGRGTKSYCCKQLDEVERGRLHYPDGRAWDGTGEWGYVREAVDL